MLAALLLASCAAPQQVGLARVRLEGPLDAARLAVGAGVTEVALELLPGERRELVLPLAHVGARPAALDAPPPGAELLGWEAPDTRLQGLPPGLLARSLPPVAGRARTLGPAALAWLGATLLALAVLRRRPVLMLVACGLGAGLALQAERGRELEGPGAVRVLEGQRDARAWVRVDVGQGALELPPGEAPGLLPLEAPGALSFAVDLGGAWWARAAGRRLAARRPLSAGLRQLLPGANAWGSLESSWTRDAAGTWSAHGPWAHGAPLPAPLASAEGPPGWLLEALPQGRGVLLGRLAPGAHGAAAGSPSWLRLVGFGE